LHGACFFLAHPGYKDSRADFQIASFACSVANRFSEEKSVCAIPSEIQALKI
jgi:hypothetical protein